MAISVLNRIGQTIGHLAIGITDCLCQSGNREIKPNRAFIGSMPRESIFIMSTMSILACVEFLFVACLGCLFPN